MYEAVGSQLHIFWVNMISSLKAVLDDIEASLSAGKYEQALTLYTNLYDASPDYFDLSKGKSDNVRRTHISNAANLARRDGYQKLQFMEQVSERLKQALELFFGLNSYPFKYPLQKPNFFYIPGLPSKPFYQEDEIAGLTEWIDQLALNKTELLAQVNHATTRYVDAFDHLPATESWTKLRDRWRSAHLVKGGELTSEGQGMSNEVRQLLQGEPLAFCPPHAPEVFLSVLKPGAEIPPHYGISNCKLTVHIPLKVNGQAHLQAGDERFIWAEHDRVLIFDDSFLHSAANLADEPRAVLIADIWNPYLTDAERQAIETFMARFDSWSNGHGKLANLDSQLR